MDISNFKYNPVAEELVSLLMTKTQNFSPQFFRLQVNFYLTLVASTMNVKIDSPITGKIPINFYGINLATSGSGKGFSTNVLENQVLEQFRKHFMMEIFPKKADLSLEIEASMRASVSPVPADEILENLKKEYRSYGSFKFSFDSATAPAIKQLRNKLLLARAGSLNLIMDEIGYNLSSNMDALVTYLELYDKGLIKEKLIKNTETNTRFQELTGSTPANALLFGTQSKLLNGGKVEDEYFELLESGYARRSFFAYTPNKTTQDNLTPEELYDTLAQQNHDQIINKISNRLLTLADINLVGTVLEMPRDVGIELVAYRQWCEARAEELPSFAEVQRAELAHRYFKTLKLAGAYAFIDGAAEIGMHHLHQAIKFSEESGKAIEQMFDREKPYERLAKFIAESQGDELTQVDIANALPFFKGNQSVKNNMVNMAIAYGYKNNIIIKKRFRDGIEFFSGESLQETDLNKMIVAYSQFMGEGYINTEIAWDKLPQLISQEGYNWLTHHAQDGIRRKSHMLDKFNLIVLDIDGKSTIREVQQLMGDFKYLIHTTKSHRKVDKDGNYMGDRFRVIFPTNYVVDLDEKEYKEFMHNIHKWLPFAGMDIQAAQQSRSWACNVNAEFFENEDGEMFDVLPFIPKTSRAEEHEKQQLDFAKLDNLERWFAQRMVEGNRNNQLANYGFMLMDSGASIEQIEDRLLSFNSKLDNKLDEAEIMGTVINSIKSRMNHRNKE